MIKSKGHRLLSFILAVLMLTSYFSVSAFMAADDESSEDGSSSTLQSLIEVMQSSSYDEYRESHKDVPKGTDTIVIDAADYDVEETTAEVEVLSEYNGKQGKLLNVPDAGRVTFKINVPKTGMYAMKLSFCSTSDKSNSIERTLYINGKVPFSEARYLQMKKVWEFDYTLQEDGTERFEIDGSGNELRPTSHINHKWQEYVFTDVNGYHNDPLEFYLEEGENTITLEALREPYVLGQIEFYPYESLPTYAEKLSEYESKGYQPVSKDLEPVYIDAECPSAVSDYTIYPINDRTSAVTEPQNSTALMMNTIGAEVGSTVGQWMEYTFEVEESGLYTFAFRYKQELLSGIFASRRLYIDGEIPYEEANGLRFNFGSNWNVDEANNGGDTLQFYLEKGTHTIRLETALGDMSSILKQVSDIQDKVNDDYLEILRLTGADPDNYRDYGFKRIMPDTITDLVTQSKNLYNIIDYIQSMSGVRSENTSVLEQAAILLEKMGTDEDQIARNLASLKTQLGNLGTWVLDAVKQPVQLDYILVQAAGADLPRAEATFFQAASHEIKQFIGSFFTDYSSLGTDSEEGESREPIEVWSITGRDQAQIIRTQINNKFIPQTNIPVILKLVDVSNLLPSVLAGVGPDLALEGMSGGYVGSSASMLSAGDVMDYAIRGAVIPISEHFDDFEEIKQRFDESAFVNLELYGKTYGLPVKQEWQMMFYRTDILASLELEVPKTWDELLAMIPVLQYNNMTIGIVANLDFYSELIYQKGGSVWADDGMRINFDSNTALEAFDMMANMYTQFSLPLTFNVSNRFRTGEMPITIGNYAETYNSIVVFATELAGLWDFGPVPGFENEDGTINNASYSVSDPTIMMRDCSDLDGAWEFMKWYTDKDFQLTYANELITVIGEAAKYASANMEALEEMPWTAHEYSQLMLQKDNLRGNPSYPGKYFIKRYVDFSIAAAYNDLADPIDTMLGYVPEINKEIKRKRDEFDFETLEIGQTLADKRIDQALDAIENLSGDDADKYSTEIDKVKDAVSKESIEDIRVAVSALEKADKTLFEDIIGYLNDAADALESYS